MVAGFGLRAQTHQDTTGRLLSADPLPCTEGAYVSSLVCASRYLFIYSFLFFKKKDKVNNV